MHENPSSRGRHSATTGSPCRQVIKRFMNDSAMEVHLLNVQPPFDSHVADFTSRRSCSEYHREEAEKALAACQGSARQAFGIPYAVHIEVGDLAERIDGRGPAPALRRDRDGDRAQRTSVPVEVVSGSEMSKWERYGIPALIGAGLAMAIAIAD